MIVSMAIRHEYESKGVERFYREHGGEYANPHEPIVRQSLRVATEEWKLDLSNVLDLAAGSGEVTLVLRELGAGRIDAIDPYTFEAYERRTGKPAGRCTFEQIAAGALAGGDYSLIVCSFALHLLEQSRLPGVAAQLSQVGDRLLILTPHKRPQLREAWGWRQTHERVVQRVRSRLYESLNRGSTETGASRSA